MTVEKHYIPLSVPNISGNELKYVSETIETEWVSSAGTYVDRFEKEFASYIGTRFAVAVMNGTAALHISLIIAGVDQNDEVLLPNLTFVAPANAVAYCKAIPVFVDSDWKTLGMDPACILSFIREQTVFENGFSVNKKTGRKVKAIIPMHTLGNPVEVDAFIELCRERNIVVIEDASESLGSEYKGKKTGALGDIACFSFNGNKIITTGGGGMITTNNEQFARRAKHISSTAKTDNIYFDHDEVGYNYRMVNVLAALGVAQMERIDEFVEIKRKNLQLYKKQLGDHPYFYMHEEQGEGKSNCWMYSLVLKEACPYSFHELIEIFSKEKIQVRPIWKLMCQLRMFEKYELLGNKTAFDISNRILNIPCSTGIKKEEIERVAEVLHSLRK
ncbi:MAG: LegC family aminotransferase [Flavobacteriales bacterium]